MQNQFDPRTTTGGYDPAVSVGVPRAARDAGLRSYMLKVYNYMASGVLLTGVVAMLFAPYARDVLINANGTGLSGLGWLITFAPLAFVVALTGLEFVIAFLQAFVFTILTCLYLNDALHLH